MEMNVVVGNDIRISNCTAEVEQFFNKLLTFDNPEFERKLRQGRWLGGTPEKLVLLQRHGDVLVLPFGMLPTVFEHRDWFSSIASTFDESVRYMRRFLYRSSITPYEYQEKAIQAALKARQGIIVAPCGSGKTQIGLEISACIGGRTLWITHTHDLLDQSMKRAKSVFKMSDRDYGTITAGKVDLGNVITFATVQTMSKIDLRPIEDYFDVVIVDEAHHAVGTPTKLMMFWKVISSLKARYKFGLTATPQRSDGLTPCMFALIGPKVYEISKEDVSETTCPVEVLIRQSPYRPDIDSILMPDGTINYPKFITEITKDADRNRQIVSDVMMVAGTSLVLTDRVEHIDTLVRMIEEAGKRAVGLSAAFSKRAKAERKGAIEKLTQGDVDVLVATFQLAREGLDIPSLRNIFFATPQKNDAIVTQAAGRVARKAEGKDCGIVWDYEDDFSILKRWQKKRISIYKRQGFMLR